MKKGCFKTTLTILAKLSLTFLAIQEASSTIQKKKKVKKEKRTE